MPRREAAAGGHRFGSVGAARQGHGMGSDSAEDPAQAPAEDRTDQSAAPPSAWPLLVWRRRSAQPCRKLVCVPGTLRVVEPGRVARRRRPSTIGWRRTWRDRGAAWPVQPAVQPAHHATSVSGSIASALAISCSAARAGGPLPIAAAAAGRVVRSTLRRCWNSCRTNSAKLRRSAPSPATSRAAARRSSARIAYVTFGRGRNTCGPTSRTERAVNTLCTSAARLP